MIKKLTDEKEDKGATPAQLELLTVENLFGFHGEKGPKLTAKEARKSTSSVLEDLGFNLGF